MYDAMMLRRLAICIVVNTVLFMLGDCIFVYCFPEYAFGFLWGLIVLIFDLWFIERMFK